MSEVGLLVCETCGKSDPVQCSMCVSKSKWDKIHKCPQEEEKEEAEEAKEQAEEAKKQGKEGSDKDAAQDMDVYVGDDPRLHLSAAGHLALPT